MNLADIRQGLENALTATGTRVYGKVPSSLNPPAAVIALADGDADQDSDIGFLVNWVVLVLLARVDDERAQGILDGFLSADTSESVFAAIRADETLGGEVDYARVVGWQPPASFEFAGNSYVGVEVNVETLAH